MYMYVILGKRLMTAVEINVQITVNNTRIVYVFLGMDMEFIGAFEANKLEFIGLFEANMQEFFQFTR